MQELVTRPETRPGALPLSRQARRVMQRKEKKEVSSPIQIDVQQALAGIRKNPSLIFITDALQALSWKVQRQEVALLTLIKVLQQGGKLDPKEVAMLEKLIEFGPPIVAPGEKDEAATEAKEDAGDGATSE